MSTTPPRILVPIDFSSCSREALRHALAWGRKLGAAVDVIHVWEPAATATPSSLVWLNGEQQSFWEHMQRELLRDLERLVDEVRTEGEERTPDDPPVKISVAAGYPSRAILALLEGGAYALVVMGSHGRRGLSRLLLGSVAERVVRMAPCPVLTVHDPAKGQRESRQHNHNERRQA